MIGDLPLWLVLAVWYIQRNKRVGLSLGEYAIRLRLLEDVRNSLPLPEGKFQGWLMSKMLGWIEREKNMLTVLRSVGVMGTFLVHADRIYRKGEKWE
jgi:hypothetical protein